jgi:hypothetical protein
MVITPHSRLSNRCTVSADAEARCDGFDLTLSNGQLAYLVATTCACRATWQDGQLHFARGTEIASDMR